MTEIVRSFPDVAVMAMMAGMAIHVNLRWELCCLCRDVGLIWRRGCRGGLVMLAACSIMRAKIHLIGTAIESKSVGIWYWFVLKMFIN